MAFIMKYQLNIMLIMSGMCGMLAFLTLAIRSLSPIRKSILTVMDLAAMMLLVFERFAFIYRGDPSLLGYYMVRISNGMVYFLQVFIPHLVTRYLNDLYRNEGRRLTPPKRLVLCNCLFFIGTAVIVVSQFTGLYYTIDEQNVYHRAPLHALCFIIPLLIVAIQESTVLQYRKELGRGFTISLMLCLSLPIVMAFVQLFNYGAALITMTLAFVVMVFFVYALNDLSTAIEQGRKREHALFEQTAEALVSAIDAKDAYTHGHSARVAMYSERIAREAGLPDEDCEKVYFAALLHDVGKIGVSNDILNKTGKLTDEEFAQIKRHTILGNQILSSIQLSPYLSLGARCHHERYDGRGYPDGLAGEAIPEIARIVAVADSYDAMTSRRSYRGPIAWDKVRSEIQNGIGTQFDPRFAEIMLRLMDSGELERLGKNVKY